MEEKYINPHTDFGFKRLFGSEFNKELLISFLNAQELKAYEESMNAYRDIVNAINTEGKIKYAEGREDGRAEGMEKRNIEIARNMLGNGESIDKIMLYTGLSKEDIEKFLSVSLQ